MTTLWIRDVRVVLTGVGETLDVSNLRVAFRAHKTLSGTPNGCELSIWNLSRGRRLAIREEFDRVRIEAGHVAAGNRGVIFDGFLRDVTHSRNGPDIITVIEAGDGDRAYRQGTIATRLDAGSTPADQIDALLAAMPDVDRGVIEGLDDLPASPRPVTLYGSVVDEMNKIGRTHQLYWSVQDGALEVIRADRAIEDVLVLGETTGLLGVPEETDNGVRCVALLNPQIRIGRVIEIRSRLLGLEQDAARYRVSAVEFVGDTRASEYFAYVHGERIDGGRVLEQ